MSRKTKSKQLRSTCKLVYGFGGDERGGVLILVAVAIGVIVVFLAIAIDVAIYSSEIGNRERTAENAVLGALKEYQQVRADAPGGPPQEAYDRALTRARRIAELNIGSFFTSRLRAISSSSPWTIGNSTATGTRLIPGEWLVDMPDDASNVARRAGCVPAAVSGKGCFRPIAETESANAFHLIYETSPNWPMKLFFWAGILPQHHPLVNAEAYSTLQPRRTSFLVDLSPSVVEDTHRSTAAMGARSEYAYDLDGASACADGSTPTSSSDIGATTRAIYDALPNGPRPSGASPTQHYKSDFVCISLPASMNGEPRYAADQAVAPQPLTAVMDSLHAALEMFRDRGMREDRVAITAFDDGLLDARNLVIPEPVPLSDPERMRRPAMSDSRFADFLNIYTDMSKPLSDRVGAYLFPRPFGSRSYMSGASTIRLPAATNIRMALNEASNLINSSPMSRLASNHVVLITDGLSNCPNNPPISGYPCFYSTTSASSLTMSEVYVQTAVNEITSTEFISRFRDGGIVVHVLLFGQQSGPHTLVRKNGSSCLTDDEARASMPPRTFIDDSGGTIDPGDTAAFYYPNRLYRLAQGTGGAFMAIRPPCRTDGVAVDLSSQCQELENDGDLLTNVNGCTDAGCAPVIVDGSGRLLCDLAGRSPQAQIAAAMSDVLKTPFMLVKPGVS